MMVVVVVVVVFYFVGAGCFRYILGGGWREGWMKG